MRKQEKDQLNVLLQMPGYVFWKDQNQRFMGCNNAFAEFFGIMPEDLVGKNEKEVAQFLGTPFEIHAGKLIDKEGKVHRMVATQKPLYNNQGKSVGIIGVLLET